MVHLAMFDVAARFDDLEPAQFAQRLRGACDGPVDRVVDALLGRSNDLNDAVDVVVHIRLPEKYDCRWASRADTTIPENGGSATTILFKAGE